jgi:hypothetical protein
MPVDQRQLDEQGVPMTFESPGGVTVRVEAHGSVALKESAIPLDGRRYVCAGEIIFADDRCVRANFELDTNARRILDRNSVWITLDSNTWYMLGEPEVPAVFGVPRALLDSWQWRPDVPLADCPPGPYSIGWPSDA